MMRHNQPMDGLVYLSGEDICLARGELRGALKASGKGDAGLAYDGQVAIVCGETPKVAQRMGFSHFDGSLVGSCEPEIASIIEIALAAIREVRPVSIGFSVKTGGRVPARNLFYSLDSAARDDGLKVRHREPSATLFAVLGDDLAYVGWVGSVAQRGSVMGRRGSQMPYSRPVVMDPRLSRAMVNLTGLPPGRRVLDPFMGPGGLAIEASHLGLRYLGVEIDPDIASGARRNLSALAVPGMVEQVEGDSRGLSSLLIDGEVFDGILTDPPFGRSASLGGSSHSDLVERVMEQARPHLERGSPLVLDTPFGKDLELIGFELQDHYAHRVHRSMTRHILVMESV